MSTIEKTEAIVLRVSPYSATSHIVTWLTPDRGRLTTMVKGACRPKSAFLGQYDLHYTCELLFYPREHGGGIPIARECMPLKMRTALRSDWQAALCAGYAGGLALHGTMPGQHVPQLYALVDRFLDFLAEDGIQRTLMPWFELALLSSLGFAPRLDSCSRCGVSMPASAPAGIAGRHGGLVCRACRAKADTGPVSPVSGAVLAMLCAWQRAQTPRGAYATFCHDKAWLETMDILGMLLAESLGETPPLRPRVARLLGSRIPSNREESP